MTFDLPALAAILAVIGYSLNDTVVVFDRIRERFCRCARAARRRSSTPAINETLSRTIMTSVTTMIAVAGAAVLRRRGAAAASRVALAIGVLVGTYSSIYIASAIALDLKLTARDLMPVQHEKGDRRRHALNAVSHTSDA